MLSFFDHQSCVCAALPCPEKVHSLCLGNIPSYYLCFLIAVKHFSGLIRVFFFLSLFISCCFPVLCSAVLIVPSPLDFQFQFLQTKKLLSSASKLVGVRVKFAGITAAKRTGPRSLQLPSGKRATLLLPLLSSALPFRSSGKERKHKALLGQPHFAALL